MQPRHSMIALAVLLSGQGALAQKIYWVNSYPPFRIQRANLDGTRLETLVESGLDEPRGLAIDPRGGKLYWAQRNRIQRSELDGTNMQTVITAGDFPHGISFDSLANVIYWTDLGDGKIRRVSTHGNDLQEIVVGLPAPVGLFVEPVSQKVWWTDVNTDAIMRANLDGTAIETILIRPASSNPEGIAVDAIGGHVYWVESSGLWRSNLVGENAQALGSGPVDPRGLVLSAEEGVVHIAEQNRVSRMDLDGGGFTVLVPSQTIPWGIALGPAAVIPASSSYVLVTFAVLLVSGGGAIIARRKLERRAP